MTIAITLILASLLIIGILRNTWDSREESSAEQVTKSPAEAEKISEPLPEPKAEIIIENPPHQAPAQKKTAPAKKTPAKSAPAKKTTSKK
jgi:tRNA1(Val) A37 N6-methylase TrmN6